MLITDFLLRQRLVRFVLLYAGSYHKWFKGPKFMAKKQNRCESV